MAPVNGFCEHHYNALTVRRVKSSSALVPQPLHEVFCSECKQGIYASSYESAAWEFVDEMYQGQTGNQNIVYLDMMGNEIKVGSKVVYPVLSGRSTAMNSGEVLEINPPTKGSDTRAARYDAPRRLKVQPNGLNSRGWRSYWGVDDEIKPITLTANAASAVVVG